MATRSYLIEALPVPEAQLIYCHKSSYTLELGKILNENYNTPEKARELMSYGDASSISETPEHSIFRHQDHGEPLERDLYPPVRHALEAVNSLETPNVTNTSGKSQGRPSPSRKT